MDRAYRCKHSTLTRSVAIPNNTQVGTAFLCDDDSLPNDSLLAGHDAMAQPVVAKTGYNAKVLDTMRSGIENAGFINVHERDFKMPIGDWPKHPLYKEAGRLCLQGTKDAMEGWLMYALTRWGLPQPWSPEEVTVYVGTRYLSSTLESRD